MTENTKESVNITPMHKVGIKLLADEQMENVFPNYEILLEKIKCHRKAIAKLEGKALADYQYNMMYDNVFAIFGKRGTGKTSVIFSLQQKLKEDVLNSDDVVLPIIIPEAIPYDCSVLGWILAIVRDQIIELEKRIKNSCSRESDGDDIWDGCGYTSGKRKDDWLSNKLDDLVESYFSGKYNPGNETSYNLAVGNSVKQARNYYQFTKSIITLWDEWIKAIRWFAEEKRGKKVTPLIYFIFDDVDLAPEKVSELMSVIIKYLSHPNIIVLMTADEEMTLEVIENNLDSKIGKLPKEWRYYLNKNNGHDQIPELVQHKGGDLNLIHDAAQLYLGKILPTSTRFYLKLYETTTEKQRFCLEEGTCLGEKLVSLIDELLELPQAKRPNNFICPKPGEDMNFYLNFFGSTSRQISNAWFGVENLIREMKKLTLDEEINLSRLFDSCIHFLRLVLNSNHDLAVELGDLDEFTNETLLMEHNGWNIYIDYPFLEEFFRNLGERKNKELHVKLILQVYSAFMFLENILLILEKCFSGGITDRRRIHGITGLSRLLNEYAFDGKIMIRDDLEAEKYFAHYRALLDRLAGNYERTLNVKKEDLDYFYDFISCEKDASARKYSAIRNAFSSNRSWLRQMIEKMPLVYGGLYLVEKRDLEACYIYTGSMPYAYQNVIEGIMRENIKETLEYFDLLEQAKLEIGKISQPNLESELTPELFEDQIDQWMKLVIDNDKTTEIDDETEYIDGNEENGENKAGDEEFEINSKRELYTTVSVVIDHVVNSYDSYSLFDLIQVLPEKLASDIRTKLFEEKEEDSIQDLLRILETFVIKADDFFDCTCTYEPEKFLETLSKLENIMLMPGEIRYLIGGIRDYVKNYIQGTEDPDWVILTSDILIDLKLIVEKIYNLSAEVDSILREKLLRALADFQKTNEKMIILNREKEQVRNAFTVGLVVCAMKKVQMLYLYKVIFKRYENGHRYSPKKLESLRAYGAVRNKSARNLSKVQPYYYDLFLKIKKLLDETIESGDDAAMQRYIDRVVSESGKRYIGKLLKEVDDESVSY